MTIRLFFFYSYVICWSYHVWKSTRIYTFVLRSWVCLPPTNVEDRNLIKKRQHWENFYLKSTCQIMFLKFLILLYLFVIHLQWLHLIRSTQIRIQNMWQSNILDSLNFNLSIVLRKTSEYWHKQGWLTRD